MKVYDVLEKELAHAEARMKEYGAIKSGDEFTAEVYEDLLNGYKIIKRIVDEHLIEPHYTYISTLVTSDTVERMKKSTIFFVYEDPKRDMLVLYDRKNTQEYPISVFGRRTRRGKECDHYVVCGMMEVNAQARRGNESATKALEDRRNNVTI